MVEYIKLKHYMCYIFILHPNIISLNKIIILNLEKVLENN